MDKTCPWDQQMCMRGRIMFSVWVVISIILNIIAVRVASTIHD